MAVQIEKPANMRLAAWFTELRSWFDENNCQPVSFVRAGRVINKLIFNVTFAEDAHARSFASKFRAFAPAVRRATSSERGKILLGKSFDGPISDEWA
jgi:glycine/D-amino acid oxidase-like deaminating enzyme